jgi:hypothetical protein
VAGCSYSLLHPVFPGASDRFSLAEIPGVKTFYPESAREGFINFDAEKSWREKIVVLIILNSIQFEAEKFETRTMPTPNMKGKEIIYWIKVGTDDKRLATDLQRFLEGAPKFIELKVPSAFIAVKTELESYRMFPGKQGDAIPSREESKQRAASKTTKLERETLSETVKADEAEVPASGPEEIRMEILLRRTLPAVPEKQTQSPYG